MTKWDRRTVDGVVYLSLGAMAEAINRHPRTVTKLERRGVIPRGRTLDGIGVEGARWYTKAEIDTYRRLATETGFRTSKFRTAEFIEAVAAEQGRQDETLARGEPPATQEKSPTLWADFRDGIASLQREEAASKVRLWASLSGEEPTPPTAPARPAPTCPCGRELLWRLEPIPGSRGSAQVPTCEVHGVVDLREPEEPNENVCRGCGAELVYDMTAEGFMPVCETCGVVKIKVKKEPMPERQASFADFPALPPPEERRRRRGLMSVAGAVRAPRPKPGIAHDYLDPPPRS